MSEEQQPVSDEQQASESETLDQVYSKFSVEETAKEFNQQPAQPMANTTQPPTDIPDPILDQAGFRSYLSAQRNEQAKALAQLTQAHQQIALGEQTRRVEADIKSAVSQIKEKVGNIDDELIEVQLDYKARKDPRFKSLFQNRDRNPAAWRAAVNAVGNEMKSKSQFRSDPQLTENVRAAKQSTQSTLTSRETSSDNPLESALAGAKTQAEFDQQWARMRG